jgi:hypothetical protein
MVAALLNSWSTKKKSKFQEDDCPEFSVHDYAFKMLIADIHEDLTVCKQAFLMTQLLQLQWVLT